MKVGISFVSVANATENLRREDPGLVAQHGGVGGPANVERPARPHPDRRRHPSDERTFYTALYHSLLHPNVVSDDNGQYVGADGRVHRSQGHAQYANFSEWDIYRSEIQLVALLAPHQAGDMIQSLVNDAKQGGWLPKWAIVGGDASQMNGDSADPIIADAYAFGVRGFDAQAALAAMVKGATQTRPLHGLEIERQYLSQYLTQHYVDAGSLDLDSIDYSDRGLGHSRVRHRRLLHRPDWPRPREPVASTTHDAAGPELGVPVQPHHRLRPGPQRRRQLPAGTGLPDLACSRTVARSASRKATPSSTPGRSPRISPPWAA